VGPCHTAGGEGATVRTERTAGACGPRRQFDGRSYAFSCRGARCTLGSD
jgi:hypothetical protein